VLRRLADPSWQPSSEKAEVVDFAKGQQLLSEHTETLFGPAPKGRGVRIMVTMPSEAAENYLLVQTLLRQGMDCMRINCAHDDAAAWLRMIEHLRQAERSLGRPCRIVIDLAGPKLRTGPLEPGPSVVRIRTRRDLYGRVISPARVWLTPETSPSLPPSPASACLQVPTNWLARLREGERVKFTDARDSKRAFEIVEVTDHGCWAEATKTAYIVPSTVLRREHGVEKSDEHEGSVCNLPSGRNAIPLKQGDLLILTRDLTPGRPAINDIGGHLLTPAVIGCTPARDRSQALQGASFVDVKQLRDAIDHFKEVSAHLAHDVRAANDWKRSH
jgi:pyruvate kinase